MYDLIIKGGKVIDPLNGIHCKLDIGIKDEKIVEVVEEIDLTLGKRVLDVSGKVIIPGIIDMHVHTGFVCKGHTAMPMMVKAGTVTAVDCGGPINEFLEHAVNDGAGMNMMCLQMVRPYWNVSGEAPKEKEFEELIDKSLQEGAIGLKLLGGHYPMTPEATRLAIEIANKKNAYIAFHVGTLASGAGNLNSFREAVDLSKNLSIHLAHVNSYCRGQILEDPISETLEVLSTLEKNPNIFSEAYLSVFSGAPGKCSNGMIESIGTANSLGMGGYEKNEKGLRKAILDGFAAVVCEYGEESIRISGKKGLDHWEDKNGNVTITFPVTPASTRFLLATQKRKTGNFVVDAIATDGGGIPRNFIVKKGIPLIHMDALSWEEYVIKTSLNPSRILGLKDKGHLGVGADADITIIDERSGSAYGAINAGNIIMLNGVVLGQGTTVITTKYGEKTVNRKKLKTKTIDLNDSWFYKGRSHELITRN